MALFDCCPCRQHICQTARIVVTISVDSGSKAARRSSPSIPSARSTFIGLGAIWIPAPTRGETFGLFEYPQRSSAAIASPPMPAPMIPIARKSS
jgi:hypothetical protein